MQKIEIKSKLTLKKYIRLMFIFTYRRIGNIFFSLFGIVMIVNALLYFFGIFKASGTSPYVQFFTGLIVISVTPLTIYYTAKRNFNTNKRLKESMTYLFDEENIEVVGESFNSTMSWSTTYKVLEMNDYILIYQSKLIANIISKDSINHKQLKDFKSLLLSIPGLKLKLKK